MPLTMTSYATQLGETKKFVSLPGRSGEGWFGLPGMTAVCLCGGGSMSVSSAHQYDLICHQSPLKISHLCNAYGYFLSLFKKSTQFSIT